MPTLTQIQYAVALDKWRHFGKAAAECHVSQPSLSMQIQKLEDELGVTLFDRSRQPVVVLPEAIPILTQMRAILLDVAELESLCALQKNGTLGGELRVGVIPTAAPYVVPAAASQLASQYDRVRWQIEELTTSDCLLKLEEGKIDCALVATPLETDGLFEIPVYVEPFYIFASADHPLLKKSKVAESDLEVREIWLLSEGHCLRDQVLQICSRNKKNGALNTSIKAANRKTNQKTGDIQASLSGGLDLLSGSLPLVIHLVETVGGYTLLPELALGWLSPEQKKRVRSFSGKVPARNMSLIFKRAQLKRPLIEALKLSLEKSLPASNLIKNQGKNWEKRMDILPVGLGDGKNGS